MIDFEKLNRRIEIVKLSLDRLDDIIQLESDKLLINWLKLIKKDLKELETLFKVINMNKTKKFFISKEEILKLNQKENIRKERLYNINQYNIYTLLGIIFLFYECINKKD